MAVNHRIRRLEGRYGIGEIRIGAGCARCRGAGIPGVTVVREPETTGLVKGGCPACGKVSIIKKIVLCALPGDDLSRDPWDII